ncbi:reticulocyte-binding protein homolog 2a-like [Mytilus edulis]|uniref:reticulocyte-binding protein homolog 2a-like n=1 Tax=Mytilus edulis TaxID=6550 RepID=UPI0039EE8B82
MPKKSKKARSTKVKENKERMRKRQEKNNKLRDGQCNNQSNSEHQSNASLNFQNIDQSVISQKCHDLDQSVISQKCHDLDQSAISQNCLDLDQSVISQNSHDLDQSVISQKCHDLDQSVISQNCLDLDQSVISQKCHDLDQSVISKNCHELDQSVISQNCHDLDQSVISQNCHDLDQSVISQNCHDFDLDESIISLHCQYTVEKDEIILVENEIENILENEIENILENRIEHLYEYETEKLDQSVSSTNYQYKRNKDDNIYQNKSEIQNQTEKLDQNQVKKLDKNRIEKLDKNRIEKLDKKIVQNQTEKLDQNQTEKQDENRIVKKKYENLIKQLDLNHNCPCIETESETVLMNKVQMEQYQSKIKNKTSFKAQCNNKINTAKVKDCVKVSRSGIRNTIVQGSFHQGDLRFGLNSGKQCVANCCSALAFGKLKDLTYWDQKYLDKVLIYGNDLYSRVSGNNHHLLISDLPPILDISGTLMQLSLKESISAVIDTSETIDFSEFGNSLPLDQALQESLVDYDACFICAYDTSFLALKHGQDLFLFDSHARNEFGLKHSNGKSLLLKLSSLDHLYQYCCNMVPGASQNQWFEVTGVSISIVEEPVMYNSDHKVPENHEQMNNTNYSNIGNHETMNTSDYELPEIVEVENEKGPDLTKVHENINQTFDIYSSESNANDNTNKNESDVEIVSATDLSYDFKPINTIAKKKLCLIVKIPTKHIHKQITNTIFDMGPPSTTKSITGDGNCLFRAISYALSNRQEFYGNIRKAIVDHLIRNAEMFKSFLQPRFKTVEEHIQTLQMKENNVWGTELEILACADLLKTDIYTYYNDSWIKYSSSQLCNKNKINVQAIYLRHLTGINHYEVVTAVIQKSRYQNRMQSSPVGSEKSEFDRKCEVPTLKIIDSDNYSDDESKVLSKAKKERIRYRKDEEFKARKISTLKRKYWENETYRDNLIQAGIKKYREDKDYRDALKESGIQKYQENDKYREKLKRASIYKYEEDEQHKTHVKQASVQKYKEDEKHKEHVKQASIQKYANDESHKCKVKQQTETRRENLKQENKQITEVIRKFKDAVEKGPECVCSCCLRLFFEKQVLICKKGSYDNSIYESCTTEKYKHTCTDDCNIHCAFEGTCRTSLWICYTCHRKMMKGKIPADSFSNGLMLEDVPLELKQLNSIEQQLIALNIPFMKIMALPKGGQKGVHGPVDKKVWYKDVAVNDEWINPIPEVNDVQVVNDESDSDSNDTEMMGNKEIQKDAFENMSKSSKVGIEREVESEQYSYIDDRLRGVQLDTCLQPADIGQEALDLCFDQVFNLAPAENNNPLSVLKEPGIEAKTFPVHFPSGKNTSDEDRDEKLTIGRYFNLRLMSVENRFARDTNYIFFSQYLTELNSVISNVQISLRKQCPFSKEGKKVTREMLCNKETLKELFKKDEAIKYLKPIRGTPPYWQSSQKDIFAMIRQLGVPTFFCSFSSADFRWSEIVNTILKQQGDMRNSENMTWDEKCKVLCSNPVTVVRMFDHRFHMFLNNVIMSEAEPIGKIIDYFYRVEFQQRGSPHTHCLFWVENAPKFGEDDIDDVITFIDKYITCEIPNEKKDKELHEIVMAVHQHSKKHSKSCKKKGTVCRFNFPRPPSTRTFISEPSDPDKDLEDDEDLAKGILSDLWEVIKKHEGENLDVSEIFKKIGLTQESFETYYRFITNRNTVVLKRQSNEIYTNQYNPHLLRAWDANMDIQYILDAFSCVVYIISYISKAERELGLLLQQTKNEAEEGNLNAQQTMQKVGTSYLHH